MPSSRALMQDALAGDAPRPPEPSNAERATWPDATRAYVEHLEADCADLRAADRDHLGAKRGMERRLTARAEAAEAALRDQFAMAALRGILANPEGRSEVATAEIARYQVADAMLKAREDEEEIVEADDARRWRSWPGERPTDDQYIDVVFADQSSLPMALAGSLDWTLGGPKAVTLWRPLLVEERTAERFRRGR